jgi:hypothetical protein
MPHQWELQARARTVDRRDDRNVDVEDQSLEKLDSVVVLLGDEVAVPLTQWFGEGTGVGPGQPGVAGAGDDDDLVVPVRAYVSEQEAPGVQQTPGPAGRLPVPVHADGEDAVLPVQCEV